jgi:1-acyl-sn-glycerol-3-phosphate acyltransferase
MKAFLGRLFAIWALLVFVLTLLLFFIPIWITGIWEEPKKTKYVFKVFDVWMTVFFVLVGIRRRFKGKEHFRKGENYVVVCNHSSLMDVPLSSPGIPGPNKTIAKAEMARIPLFGIVYRRGSVLVDRRSEESRRSSYGRMREVLDMGLHMCIYPEGTRNKSASHLQRFHDGAFKLALASGKSVIPAIILHTSEVLPINKPFYFWPRPVDMHFLHPVSPVGKTVSELRDEVFAIMNDYLEARRNGADEGRSENGRQARRNDLQDR